MDALRHADLGFPHGHLDQRIAVSERAKASQARWLPGDYEVIPNGVLVPDLAPVAVREHRIVFAGRQDRGRGCRCSSARGRRSTGARPPLTVAGADPLAVRLLLTRLRVNDAGIDVVGFLSQDELTGTLLRSKVFLAPSLGPRASGWC